MNSLQQIQYTNLISRKYGDSKSNDEGTGNAQEQAAPSRRIATHPALKCMSSTAISLHDLN
jgi:hypothetical protein